MSKTQLKKELSTMDREQIIQVVLDAYSARKETRDYFEFFLNPDVDKLYDKTLAAIDKELMRGKHGRNTSRITVIRRAIKEFSAYDPGAEYVLRLMLDTLNHILIREKYVYYKETFEKGVHKLIDDIMAYADAHALVDTAASRLHEMSRDMNLGTASFRGRMLRRFMFLS